MSDELTGYPNESPDEITNGLLNFEYRRRQEVKPLTVGKIVGGDSSDDTVTLKVPHEFFTAGKCVMNIKAGILTGDAIHAALPPDQSAKIAELEQQIKVEYARSAQELLSMQDQCDKLQAENGALIKRLQRITMIIEDDIPRTWRMYDEIDACNAEIARIKACQS